MKHLALILITAASLAAQTTVVGGSGGGGASTLDGLTDVTITSAADGDGLRHNGTAFVNTALFTAGASNLLASVMQTNVRTAIGAGLTNDRIPSVSAGVLVDDHPTEMGMFVNGVKRAWVSTGGFHITDGRTLYLRSASTFPQMTGTGGVLSIRGNAGSGIVFYAGNDILLSLDNGQTALFQDSKATTGNTSVIVKGGAGQSTTDLMQWQDNAGAVLGRITSDGYGKLPAVQLVDPGTKPSCTSDTRGMIWYDAGGAGVADTAEICGKDAADAYAWVAIATF